MKYPILFGEISISSLIFILMALPAKADRISDRFESMDKTHSKTLLAQSLIVITGVQLQETPNGIDVILETASGETLQDCYHLYCREATRKCAGCSC